MKASLGEDGELKIGHKGRAFLWGLDLRLRRAGRVLTLPDFQAGPWVEEPREEGQVWHCRLSLGAEEALELRIIAVDQALRVEAEFLGDFEGLQGSLDYRHPPVIIPVFTVEQDLSYFLCTFGLDGAAGEFPGGYWPEARWGKVAEGFPQKPWAPVVFFDEEGAVALAPGELFLTSPFIPCGRGFGRALAGDFPKIPKGTILSTWISFGENPGQALLRLGELLGKGAPGAKSDSSPLLSRLGYWNAYGSYYTELLRPLNEQILLALAEEFQRKHLPVGYFGLDLWYPYARPGRAKAFRPDPRKYPQGLNAVRAKTGIPFVLHLSALSEENAYQTDGADPGVYEEIAAEVRAQGGVAVWHDWLRTWQFVTPKLLSDPWAAEHWFFGMCRTFREADLPVLLCMQTMGMVMASAREPNVVSARSYTDQLFSQRLALAQAQAVEPGIEEAWIRPVERWRQNLLVGFVQWAFGLRPFHDLFLSAYHPGHGGEHAQEEAALRALSCGPVGFGDALGKARRNILERLLLPGGELVAQPESPPVPLWQTLSTDTPQFLSVHRAGEASWVYWVAINLGKEARQVRAEIPLSGDLLAWDPLRKEIASDRVVLPPESLAYRVFLPVRNGISLLGFPDLYVPAPARRPWRVWWEGKWVWEVDQTDHPLWALRDGRLVLAEDVVRLIRRSA
ncbi:MAG: hypothetical protein ACUVQS_07105 [Candidatus Bipolaricaulaceae bacterium]